MQIFNNTSLNKDVEVEKKQIIKIDFDFLVFMMLITTGNIGFKLAGILLISILRPQAFLRIKFHSIQVFYSLFLMYALFHGAFYLFEKNYWIIYALIISFWTMSFLAFSQIFYFLKKNPMGGIHKTLVVFFWINILISILQYIVLCLNYRTVNPFSVTPAAGDFIAGIFANSSVNMIICAFAFLYFIFRKKVNLAVFNLVIVALTGFMSGITLFVGSIVIFIVVFSNLKFKYRIYGFLAALAVLGLFSVVSPNNLEYAMGYLRRLSDPKNQPYKMHSYYQTAEFVFGSPKDFLFGAGPGNFSSRVAFSASCDYVDWYPKKYRYISEPFRKNHLELWKHDFKNPWDNRENTANQPFSSFNRILGEYGFLGSLLFVFMYLGYFIRNKGYMTYGKIMIISLLAFCLIDYWLEYLSVFVIFELLMMVDIKEQWEKRNVKA